MRSKVSKSLQLALSDVGNSMYDKRGSGDFTIRCSGVEHKVDDFVLRFRSDVLARACDGGFKADLTRSTSLIF